MAQSINSWLVPAIVSHRERYGADFDQPRQGHYVQVLEFLTFRSDSNPHQQIVATVADRTHRFKIRFDVAATDAYEQQEARLAAALAEPLTSHLRAILEIKSFKFALSSPKPVSPYEMEIPGILLDVMEWTVRSGDATETVYWPDAKEIGKADIKAVEVLREWWHGQDKSADVSEQVKKQWRARRAIGTEDKEVAAAVQDAANRSAIYTNYGDGKKEIPDALWTIPPDQAEELDQIKIFGLDPVRASEEDSDELSAGQSDLSSVVEGADGGADGGENQPASSRQHEQIEGGSLSDLESLQSEAESETIPWEKTPSPQEKPGSAVRGDPANPSLQPTPEPLQSRSPQRTSAAMTGEVSLALSQSEAVPIAVPQILQPFVPPTSPLTEPSTRFDSNSDEDEDDELIVRPVSHRVVKRKSLALVEFDPLDFGQPTAPVDEGQGRPEQHVVKEAAENVSAEVEELSGSLASESRLHLKSWTERTGNISGRVLVPETDKDANKTDVCLLSIPRYQDYSQASQVATSSARKRRRSASESSSPTNGRALTPHVSMEADDEEAHFVPTSDHPVKKLRVELGQPVESPTSRSALAYLNPLNYFRSGSSAAPAASQHTAQSTASSPITLPQEPAPQSASLLSRLWPGRRGNNESWSGTSDGEEDGDNESAQPFASAAEKDASESADENSSEAHASSVEGQPAKGQSQQERVSPLAPTSPIEIKPRSSVLRMGTRAQMESTKRETPARGIGRDRLRGFKPVFTPADGLSEEYVLQVLAEATAVRSKRKK